MSAVEIPTNSSTTEWVLHGLWIGVLIMLMSMAIGGRMSFSAAGRTAGIESTTIESGDYTGSCVGVGYQIEYDGEWLPDEDCTGWEPTGVTLTAYTGGCTISSPTTIDSKTINCNPLNINSNNVTITRSQINGIVSMNSATRTGVLLEDVTVDGQDAGGGGAGQMCFGGVSDEGGATAADYVVRRAHVVGCQIPVYGRGITVEWSYFHDAVCIGQTDPIETHREMFLMYQGPAVVQFNNIDGNLRTDTCDAGEGTTALAVIFVGKGFWGNASNITFEGNRFGFLPDTGHGAAVYCIYPGKESTDTDPDTATNIRWENNYFARNTSGVCGLGGAVFEDTDVNVDSCFENNRFEDDGELIEPTGADPCPF